MALFILLFVGFGTGLWLHGGEAFNPGKLSAVAPRGTQPGGVASHADLEHQCESCHRPLETTQDTLCLACHTEVAEQLTANSGPHSKLDVSQTCRGCHPDHRGRDFSPALAAIEYYAHDTATFSMERHRFDYSAAPMSCTACHTAPASGDYTANMQACKDCHAAEDPTFVMDHGQRFGEDCLACHDGLDTLAEFDHNSTDLPLEGRHSDLDCLECHVVDRTTGKLNTEMNTACSACHSEPQKHTGFFPATCEDCHTSMGWSPATLNGELFQHESTKFSLARHTFLPDGQPVTCVHCHTQDLAVDQFLCLTCHQNLQPEFMPQHLVDFGADCLLCHDGVDRMHDFDHNNIFVLDGAHAALACTNCHQKDPAQAPVYVGLGRACADCHREPEIHAGAFGLQCDSCHTTTAWHPARLTNHTFPLDHGKTLSECSTCHPTVYTAYTCYGCHEHQEAKIIAEHREENISAAEIVNCVKCHPTGREEEGEGGGDD